MDYVIGLDLGQSMDYSAAVILEGHRPMRGVAVPLSAPRPQAMYAVRYLHRWQLGTPYPVIVQEVAELYRKLPPGKERRDLVLDSTGAERRLRTCSARRSSPAGGQYPWWRSVPHARASIIGFPNAIWSAW